MGRLSESEIPVPASMDQDLGGNRKTHGKGEGSKAKALDGKAAGIQKKKRRRAAKQRTTEKELAVGTRLGVLFETISCKGCHRIGNVCCPEKGGYAVLKRCFYCNDIGHWHWEDTEE